MEHVRIGDAGGKGHGLFTIHAIKPNTTLYQASTFTIAAISSSNLTQFCYNCFGGSDSEQLFSIRQDGSTKLKICTGCRVAHFCGRQCQARAWNDYHKRECKVFAKFQPRILPEAVRAVVTFLLRHETGSLGDGVWSQVLSSMAHINELQERGGEEWLNLMLMAKAAHTYSKTKVDLDTVMKLICILKINGMTLTTTLGDTVGVFLDPILLKLNHRCNPNVAVYRPLYTNSFGWTTKEERDLPAFKLIPLHPLAAGEELCITYVDSSDHFSDRQAALSHNYFFACSCPQCQRDREDEAEYQREDAGYIASHQEWRVKFKELLTQHKSGSSTVTQTTSALAALARDVEAHRLFEPTIAPYPQLIHELSLLYLTEDSSHAKEYDQALAWALKRFLVVDHMVYPSPHHPTRISGSIFVGELLALLDSPAEHPELVKHRKAMNDKGISPRSWRWIRLRVAFQVCVHVADSGLADLLVYVDAERASIAGDNTAESLRFLNDKRTKLTAVEEFARALGLPLDDMLDDEP